MKEGKAVYTPKSQHLPLLDNPYPCLPPSGPPYLKPFTEDKTNSCPLSIIPISTRQTRLGGSDGGSDRSQIRAVKRHRLNSQPSPASQGPRLTREQRAVS